MLIWTRTKFSMSAEAAGAPSSTWLFLVAEWERVEARMKEPDLSEEERAAAAVELDCLRSQMDCLVARGAEERRQIGEALKVEIIPIDKPQTSTDRKPASQVKARIGR